MKFSSSIKFLLPALIALSQAEVLPELFENAGFEGEKVYIPVDGTCHDLSQFDPDLTKKASSIRMNGARCEGYLFPNCMGGVEVIDEDVPDIGDLGFDDVMDSIMCSLD